MLLDPVPFAVPHRPEDDRLRCSIELSTSFVPPAEQFEHFRSWYSRLVEVSPLSSVMSPFPARLLAWNFGRLTFAYLSAPEVSFVWRNHKKPTIDTWCLHLALPRASNAEVPKVGELSLFSLADQFSEVSVKCDHLILYMPANLHILQSSRMVLRDEAKLFLADYMLLLFRSFPTLRATDVTRIDVATTNLLGACLVPSPDHAVHTQRPLEMTIMSRASRIIEQYLGSATLTPNLICRETGVSRSRLYRIFEPYGGISAHIRRERLRKTREALEDSSDSRPIFTIAEQWGFWDPSTYSRMFKKEFGVSPSEARALSTCGAVASKQCEGMTLRDLLFSNY